MGAVSWVFPFLLFFGTVFSSFLPSFFFLFFPLLLFVAWVMWVGCWCLINSRPQQPRGLLWCVCQDQAREKTADVAGGRVKRTEKKKNGGCLFCSVDAWIPGDKSQDKAASLGPARRVPLPLPWAWAWRAIFDATCASAHFFLPRWAFCSQCEVPSTGRGGISLLGM